MGIVINGHRCQLHWNNDADKYLVDWRVDVDGEPLIAIDFEHKSHAKGWESWKFWNVPYYTLKRHQGKSSNERPCSKAAAAMSLSDRFFWVGADRNLSRAVAVNGADIIARDLESWRACLAGEWVEMKGWRVPRRMAVEASFSGPEIEIRILTEIERQLK